MNKHWKPGKKSVPLDSAPRPSRIRRDPVGPSRPQTTSPAWWQADEWEVRFAVTGILLFALALFIITIGASAITGG